MSDTDAPEDRRARRSRQAMTGALMALMHRHDWADISVQMICDQADVARSTFYAHYQTRQDLLDDLFLTGTAEVADHAQIGVEPVLRWLAHHLSGAAVFHRRLQGTPAGLTIMARFRGQIRQRLAEALAAEGHDPNPETLDFVVGGVFAVLESWLQSGCRTAPDSLAQDLARRLRQVAILA